VVMPGCWLWMWRHRREAVEFRVGAAVSGLEQGASRSRAQAQRATMSYAFLAASRCHYAGSFGALDALVRCYTTQESGSPDGLLLLALWLEIAARQPVAMGCGSNSDRLDFLLPRPGCVWP